MWGCILDFINSCSSFSSVCTTVLTSFKFHLSQPSSIELRSRFDENNTHAATAEHSQTPFAYLKAKAKGCRQEPYIG
jgi:hypothetical protein